ncbi:MAG: disulfide bond formation protein B [Rugosibacter sp.]|nr:disulfide bond formation protein B [Rugosibacter sp.]
MRSQPAPRITFLLIGLVAVGLVAGGLILARTLNLAACPLCILQRMAYLLLALEGLLAATLAVRPAAVRGAAQLMGLTALTGASIAAYQTWLQRFAKGASCAADQPWWERFVDWAGVQYPLLFEATGLCSEAGWKFLGLSIAEWSLIIFTTLTLFSLRLMLRSTR